MLAAGQVIRFLGRDGKSRAVELAEELHGRCTLDGNCVKLTVNVRFYAEPRPAGNVPLGVDDFLNPNGRQSAMPVHHNGNH